MKAAIVTLLFMVAYLSVQVITLRHEKRKHWEHDPRSYMLIQSAYQEGYDDGRKGVQP